MTIRRPIIISAILIFAMACLSLAAAIVLPGTVPLRFNAHGVPTSYGSPFSAGADAACRIGAVGSFCCIGAG